MFETQPKETSSVHSLELTKSPEGLPAVEIHGASPETRKIVRRIMISDHADDPEYALRQSVGAFLQGDGGGWMLIEFWKGSEEEHQKFLDYLKKAIDHLE